MADVKISALVAIDALAAADELAVADASDLTVSKAVTATQIQTFVKNLATGAAAAGSAPLKFTAGTLNTTAEDGAMEMDADCLYFTVDAGNRGIIPVFNIIRQDADRAAFANNTNQQAIFNSVTNGAITLEVGTYFFEALVQIKVTSATSGNLKFSLAGAGTGTFATILYTVNAIDAAVDTLTAWSGVAEIVSTQVVANMATAATATVTTFMVRGTFECTVAGTLIPSVAQTTGVATAVTTAGSYFQLTRIGSVTATNVGQWS